jgi:hypothetical protein
LRRRANDAGFHHTIDYISWQQWQSCTINPPGSKTVPIVFVLFAVLCNGTVDTDFLATFHVFELDAGKTAPKFLATFRGFALDAGKSALG